MPPISFPERSSRRVSHVPVEAPTSRKVAPKESAPAQLPAVAGWKQELLEAPAPTEAKSDDAAPGPGRPSGPGTAARSTRRGCRPPSRTRPRSPRRTSRGAASRRRRSRAPRSSPRAHRRRAQARPRARRPRAAGLRRGCGSLRAALEDVGVGHLHRPSPLRGRERPAPHVGDDAALHRLAAHGALLHQRVAHPAHAVDDEQHRHLAVQGRVLGELLLVAVLHLVVVALDDAVDHVAREAADHDGAAGDELRLLLAPPAQVDVPVPSPAAAGVLRPQAADADRRPAAALAGAARTEPADAVRVARARPPLHAAQGGGDPGPALGKLHSLRSPQLSDEFAPESENLAAVIYHRHCLWPQVRETMDRFATRDVPMRDRVKSFLARNPTGAELAAAVDSGEALPAPVRRRVRNDERIEAMLAELRRVDGERGKVAGDAELMRSALGPELLDVLGKRHDRVAAAVGATIRERLAGLVRVVDSLDGENEIVGFETLKGEKEFLEERIDRDALLAGQKLYRPKVAGSGHEYWQFDGEYWPDEVGYYRYTVKDACPKGERVASAPPAPKPNAEEAAHDAAVDGKREEMIAQLTRILS